MSLHFTNLDQMKNLSANSLALLLGANTPQNRMLSFLRATQAVMQCHGALLHFLDEPYLWWFQAQEIGLQAIARESFSEQSFHFDYVGMIDERYTAYSHFSQDLNAMGFEHRNFIAFNFDLMPTLSKAQLILFDHNITLRGQQQNLDIIQYLIDGLVRELEQCLDFAQLQDMYEQQSTLNASKTKFFQIIAHDLRAPFQGLLGFSELLALERHQMEESGVQDISDYLYGTAKSTYNLLENLLSWAVAEGGRMEFHPVHFRLKQSSHIVLGVLNLVAFKKKIRLDDQISEDLMVYADINMVTSVIQNLVSNALKFTPTDGTGLVCITAQLHQHHIEICVTDNGVGMTDIQLKKMFQPHTKVSLIGTSGEKGVGLGLLLCKRFIDINHGKLSVCSKPNQGTTVRVTLPRSVLA